MFHQLLHLQWSRHQYSKVVLIVITLVVVVFVLMNVPQQKATQSPALPPEKQTQIIVLPHHDLLLEKFPSFYANIIRHQPVKKIIFLSPNHFQPESTVIEITDADLFVSDEASITVDRAKNFDTPLVVDNEAFSKEHGVLLHLPFIKKYFPDATILPLLLTRNLSKNDVESLVLDIQSRMDENTLLIISNDFSHYLPFAEAEKKDQGTLSLIKEQNAEQILRLSDDYVDCPACIYVAVQLQATQMKEPEILFHGNSAQYLTLSADQQTTSYFVIRW